MLIVGDKEAAANAVSIRKRDGADLGSKSIEEFINDIKNEISDKSL